ncbi:MAG TPA: Flp pilus assembly protein CpaB [Methylotenera sp.]|nr:Flp pilus assembly protein CpaB [Methylotenera sp.]
MALRLGKLRINRLWALVVTALLLGLFATWLAITYLHKREKAIETELANKAKGGVTRSVVVPTSDLPKGFVIDETAVAGRDIAEDLVYQDTLTVDDFDAIRGKPLLRAVQKGRPLMREDIIDDTPKDFSQILTKGMRAITLDTDDVNSIAQMLKPGNFIDLHLIAPEPGNTSGQQVFLFLQHVKVLATGTVTANQKFAVPAPEGEAQGVAPYATITVEVTPEEAAYIALAQQSGRIRATLRPVDDTDIAAYDPVTSSRLIGSNQKGGGLVLPAKKVEYIVGGGGTGAAAPININIPSLPATPAAAAAAAANPAIPGLPAAANLALGKAISEANPAAYAPR